MAIPLAGIAVSVLALRQIAASGGTLAGKWAAVTGLVLCVVFAVAPVTRVYVLRSIRTHQADEFAHNWIDMMLSGKTDRAFRLTMDSTRPPRPPEPGQPPPKGTPFDAFMELPIVKAIVAAGPDATIRPIGPESYDARSFHQVYRAPAVRDHAEDLHQRCPSGRVDDHRATREATNGRPHALAGREVGRREPAGPSNAAIV